jgi:acyl-coenzyme A synthetase/AMP-(fatty) acid ligase
VQVVDDAGRALPPGRIGLVRARVLDGLSGYVGDEAASLRFFRDGFFYSGDLGTFGPDGRLRLSGRVTDVINVMGHKMAPDPIERDLQERLAVDAVCLLSLPGPDGCDDVHVVIESRRDITHAELEQLAQGPLRQFGRLHFRVVAALPRNAMGKVQRLLVRQQLQDATGD